MAILLRNTQSSSGLPSASRLHARGQTLLSHRIELAVVNLWCKKTAGLTSFYIRSLTIRVSNARTVNECVCLNIDISWQFFPKKSFHFSNFGLRKSQSFYVGRLRSFGNQRQHSAPRFREGFSVPLFVLLKDNQNCRPMKECVVYEGRDIAVSN